MGRLTYKTQDGWVGVNEQEDKTVSPTSVALHKLCELEDVLEKYGIENLEEYISALREARKLAIEEGKTQFKRYIEEVTKREKLEQELAELKQKAIVPKYRQGQLVYILYNNIPSQVSIDKIIIKAKIESKFSQFNKIEIKYKVDYDAKYYNENDIFATQKEAEQKLAEIGGEDE